MLGRRAGALVVQAIIVLQDCSENQRKAQDKPIVWLALSESLPRCISSLGVDTASAVGDLLHF